MEVEKSGTAIIASRRIGHRYRILQIFRPVTVMAKPVGKRNELGVGHNSTFVDHFSQFWVALIVGALLLAPIIAGSFVHTQNLKFIIVSVSVFLFSLMLRFISSASNREILAGLTGYATILVVFVGSALSTTSKKWYAAVLMKCPCSWKCSVKCCRVPE
jgi:hypothetical protein